MTSQQLAERYGGVLVYEPYVSMTSAWYLHKVLREREPPVPVKYATVLYWYEQKWQEDAVGHSASSARDCEEKYGDVARELVGAHPTAYKLQRALAARASPIHVSDGVLKQWVKVYSGCSQAGA